MDGSRDEIGFLARSSARIQIFEELYENKSLKKEALRARVDASRTSIQRNIDSLKERGWIDGNNQKYWITHSGKPVTEQFLKLLHTIHAAKRLQPFLEWTSQEQLGLELHSLATADLTTSDENDPYAPVNRHVELMQAADQFRGLLPAIGLQPMMAGHNCVVEQEAEQEIILDSNIVDTLQSNNNYREIIEGLLESKRCDILVSNKEVPFYLGIGAGVVQIGVADDDGTPQSLVETEAKDVQEWADETYHEFKTAAEPFDAFWFDQSEQENEIK